MGVTEYMPNWIAIGVAMFVLGGVIYMAFHDEVVRFVKKMRNRKENDVCRSL